MGIYVGVMVVAALLGAEPARAHGSAFLGGTAPADVFRELATLFGPDAAFSARIDVVRESGTRPTLRQHLTYHLAPGRLRVDEDINETTGMPGDGKRQKEHGIDVQIRVVDLNPSSMTYLIFPRLEAYAAYADPSPASIEVERSVVGEETLDGVACLKVRIGLVVGGEPSEYTVWVRKDDPRIPVKLYEHVHEEVTATFRDVRLGPPAAPLFEVPADYARFDSVRKVMEAGRPIKKQPGAQ
jgi:hypothetical protein